jgi:hypothetical protein
MVLNVDNAFEHTVRIQSGGGKEKSNRYMDQPENSKEVLLNYIWNWKKKPS